MSRLAFVAALLAALLAATPLVAGDITPARLANAAAEPQNWLMSGGDLAARRYSRLDLINRDTVGRLKLLQTIPYGEISAGQTFERMKFSAPLVEEGAVYVVDGMGRVLKYRLGTGTATPIWTAEPALHQMDKWLLAQWSLVRYRDWVILATGDGELFWIDADTGRIRTDIQLGDPRQGYALVAPPVVVGDRLIVGGAGGDRGARPRVDALDAATGRSLWSFVPSLLDAPPEAPFVAGGSFLRSGSYDEASGLMLWSTSTPLPAFTPQRRGTGYDGGNTVFALDIATGALRWARRYHDAGGFSEEGTLPLFAPDGAATLALHLGDDGRFYRLDAASGEALSTTPVTPGIERIGAPLPGCPNIRAERQMPGSLSLRTQLYYAAANNGCRSDLSELPGLGGDAIGGNYADKTNMTGALLALDPATGAARATRLLAAPLQSGLLSTAGGLVFAVTADGLFSAFDDETLATLWSHKLSSVIASPPITYAMDGRQYVMLVLGGGPFYSELPYVPGDMRGVRHLTVLAIYGLEP